MNRLLPLLLAMLVCAAAPAVAQGPAPAPAKAPDGGTDGSGPEEGGALARLAAVVPAEIWERTWNTLQGQTLQVGAGYGQGTFKFSRFGGDAGANPQLTDNGQFRPFLRYESPESYFAEVPIRDGKIALGYHAIVEFAQFAVERQLRTSAFVGDDLGTSIRGFYLVGAPQVFARVGPLYPRRAIFWKFGIGLGLGLVGFDGTLLPHNGRIEEAVASASSGGNRVVGTVTTSWELQMERWVLLFRSLVFNGQARGQNFSYELYGLDVGYSFRF